MRPNEFFEQRAVRLIAFAIDKREFTIQQALNASKMRPDEFFALAAVIFTRDDIACDTNRNEVLEWRLRPDALFGYLALQQYDYSIVASRRASWIAIFSIAISAPIGLASLLIALEVF